MKIAPWCLGCDDVGDGGEFLGDASLGDTGFGDVMCGDCDCFSAGEKFCGEREAGYDVCLDGGGGGGGVYLGGEFCGETRVVMMGTLISDDDAGVPCVIVVVCSGSSCTDGMGAFVSGFGGNIV